MADSELRIRIEGDASGATAVLANTNEQIVSLKGAMDDAGGSASKLGDSVSQGGKAAEYSMMEARHSVMLLGEEFGVHMPRAVSSMIAGIAPLGPLLEAAFPILAAVALIGVVEQAVEHFEAAKEAVAKFAGEERELSTSSALAVEALQLENLKLDDQIAKLEGGHKNGLQEALLEANVAAGKLADGLDKDAEKSRKLMEDTSFLSKAWEDFKFVTDLTGTFSDNYNKVDEALGRVRSSQEAVNAAEQEMVANKTPESQKAWADSVQDLMRAQSQALGTLRDYGAENGANAAKVDELTKAVTRESAALKENVLDQQKASSEARIHADEAAKAATDLNKQQIAEQESLYAQQIKLAADYFKGQLALHKIGVEEAEAAEKDAADSEYNNKVEAINRQLGLLKGSSDETIKERDKLDSELQSAEAAHQEAIQQIDNTYAVKRQELEVKSVTDAGKQAIDATKEGSAARVAAIDAAIADMEDHELQWTDRYKELQQEKTKAVQAEVAEEAKLREDAAKRDEDVAQSRAATDAKYLTFQAGELEKAGNFAAAQAKITQSYNEQAAAIQAVIAQQTQLAALAAASGTDQTTALNAVAEAKKKLYALDEQELEELAKIRDADPWNKMVDDLRKATTTMQLQVGATQTLFSTMNSGISSSLTQWIEYGQGAGRAIENMFVHMLTSEATFAVEWLAKKAEMWLLEKVLQQSATAASGPAQVLSAAAIGTANAIASFALAPWPIDMGAPAFGAAIGSSIAALAPEAAAAQGGVFENDALTMVHAKEMVLDPKLSEFVQSSAARASGGFSGGGNNVSLGGVHINVNTGGGDFDPDKHGPAIMDMFGKQAKMLGLSL